MGEQDHQGMRASVTVADARRLKVISASNTKTDRRECHLHRCATDALGSMGRTSAILPSPNRICKMSDNTDYVNHINLHTQSIPITWSLSSPVSCPR